MASLVSTSICGQSGSHLFGGQGSRLSPLQEALGALCITGSLMWPVWGL